MYRTVLILLGICICVSFINCSDNPVEPEPDPPRELTAGEKELVRSYNDFGIELFRAIIEIEPDKNVFISPLSVSMALGMALNGAAGDTEEAMRQTLAFSGMTMEEIDECYQSLIALLRTLDGTVDFRIANSIWYRDVLSFEAEFFNACSTHFDATVRGLNFSDPGSADIINSWVREQTNDRILEIVDKPIDPLLIMFLINAIYFKGTWTHQFDPARTQDDSFYLPNGSTVTCRMMNQEESSSYTYFQGDGFEALDLAYGRDLFSMSIILPRQGVDVDSIIAQLSGETWDDWMDRFGGWRGEVRIPKFQLEYDLELKDVLSQLGMGIAFDPYDADFTRMYNLGGVFISKVKHKTFVKVDEVGTEAAAVTSVETGVTSGPPVFYARRPFVFAIREKHSNTILFIGKIYDPGY
jgi:serpin B